MTTRISGLGSSGLDIDALVTQTMQAKRVPIDKMKQKMTYLNWQKDAYREMNTDMSSFMTEAQKLTLQTTFLAKKATMSTSDADKVKAVPTAGSLSGNFTLEVSQLAKSATVNSGKIGTFTGEAGTLKITGELGAQNVTISSGDTIGQIVANINQQTAKTGVKAVYDQISDKMTLVSSQTGLAASVRVEETSSSNLEKLKLVGTGIKDTGIIKGQDAQVNFNGTGSISVRSNNFTLSGINFTLLADPGPSSSYTINGSNSSDVDSVVQAIKSAFTKYNALIEKSNTKLSEARYRNYDPLTDDQKKNMKEADITLWEQKAKSGLLKNDSILSAGLQKMRLNLSTSVTDSAGASIGQYDTLAKIGITTSVSSGTSSSLAYTENGKIYIDEDKLRTALTNAPDQVAALFTATGTRDVNNKLTNWNNAGIGTRLYETVKGDIVNGLTQMTQIVPSKSYLNKQIDDYASRISTAEYGLNDYEQQLYSKYSSMEKALSKLNSQGSYISNMFK